MYDCDDITHNYYDRDVVGLISQRAADPAFNPVEFTTAYFTSGAASYCHRTIDVINDTAAGTVVLIYVHVFP